MNLSQLQEKRNKLMTDMSAIVEGDFTPEKRTQFDTLTADVAVLDGDIARVKAAEEHRAAMKNPVNQPRPNPSESNDPEERADERRDRQERQPAHAAPTPRAFRDSLGGQGWWFHSRNLTQILRALIPRRPRGTAFSRRRNRAAKTICQSSFFSAQRKTSCDIAEAAFFAKRERCGGVFVIR